MKKRSFISLRIQNVLTLLVAICMTQMSWVFTLVFGVLFLYGLGFELLITQYYKENPSEKIVDGF